MSFGTEREFLRHALATIAYRGRKAMSGVPAGFGDFDPGHGAKSPVRIVAHIGDLFDWALSLAQGKELWKDAAPLPWDEEVARFHRTLEALDAFLASGQELKAPVDRLFQGPVADALTHVGQIAMLRRLAGSPIKGENFFKAGIETGKGLGRSA